MDTPSRMAVRRALDELKPYLGTYVRQQVAAHPGARGPAGTDTGPLLGAMIDNWDAVFARVLPRSVRPYLFELRDVRNRWAHEEPFSEDEVRRALDTARLVAQAIGAPRSVLDAIAQLPAPVPNRSAAPPPDKQRVPEARSGRKPETQRDVMRRIHARFASDEERIIREYAAAERRGEAPRARNAYGLSPEDYARRLLADGRKKGWLG